MLVSCTHQIYQLIGQHFLVSLTTFLHGDSGTPLAFVHGWLNCWKSSYFSFTVHFIFFHCFPVSFLFIFAQSTFICPFPHVQACYRNMLQAHTQLSLVFRHLESFFSAPWKLIIFTAFVHDDANWKSITTFLINLEYCVSCHSILTYLVINMISYYIG